MDGLLVRRAVLDGRVQDLRVRDGRIAALSAAPLAAQAGERVLDGTGKILVPPFYNGHTHAPMNLLRGFADDLQLMDWLQRHIWPAEAHLTDEIVYAGTRLAILEMIRTGTVFFNDMYWHAPAVARAAAEMKMRCAVAMQSIETGGPGVNDPKNVAANAVLKAMPRSADAGVFATYAAHAIYTVCEDSLRRIGDAARAEDTFLHMHVSETRGEVETCRREHGGRTPVAYLDDLGLLGPKTIMAHCVWLEDDDIRRIRDRGAVIVHNAQSNLKLASGFFPFKRAVEEGRCRTILGTDGCASNNALSMFAEMKAAALLAKTVSDDPTTAAAERVWRMATADGAAAFGLDAGALAPGRAADFLLLDASSTFLVPGFNLASDLVYAADSSCVDTVVCAGHVLMEQRRVPGEAAIIAEARAAAAALAKGARG